MTNYCSFRLGLRLCGKRIPANREWCEGHIVWPQNETEKENDNGCKRGDNDVCRGGSVAWEGLTLGESSD